MAGTPIQIGQGGTDWRKVALIGGAVGVVALVILRKAGGSGGAADLNTPAQLSPNAALAIGQVETDLLNAKGELAKQLADQGAQLAAVASVVQQTHAYVLDSTQYARRLLGDVEGLGPTYYSNDPGTDYRSAAGARATAQAIEAASAQQLAFQRILDRG